jgi:dUTP pyrophosphatase
VFTAIPGQEFADDYQEFPYNVGDRVAQIYFEEVLPISFEIVSELEQSERGEGGFGSTGIK